MANEALTNLLSHVKDSIQESTFYDKPKKLSLGITGHCPHCGAPVFSDKMLFEGEVPRVEYSCTCRVSKQGHCQSKEAGFGLG